MNDGGSELFDRPWFRHYERGVPHEYPTICPLFGDDLEGPADSLWQQFDRTCRTYGDIDALVFEGSVIIYRRLHELVENFAAALVRIGVRRGDKVVLQLPNCPQMVIGYFAVHRVGAVAVMANPMYVAPEIAHILEDSDAKTIITLDAFWTNTVSRVKKKSSLENVIVTGIAEYLRFPKKQLFPILMKRRGLWARVRPEPFVHRFDEMLRPAGDIPPATPGRPDDMACLQYTGGTTGVSKGAILTHRNLLANAHQVAVWFPGLRSGAEVFLCALPFFHVFGLTICLNLPIAIGATMLVIPDPRNLKSIVSKIEKHRATMFPAVPALFEGINRFPHIERRDLSSIRGCFSGSAPLAQEVMTRFEKLTGARITEGFGLTEASPVTHVNPLFGLRKEGSIGIPMPGTDSKIVDMTEGTTEMPVGEPGELIVRGPQVMKAYWNHDEETAATIRDGWLFTGDIAIRDDDGYFFISGRKKELIIAGGYNIYPREIDEVLYLHPGILEAASVGVPDAHRGETVWAFVVPRPGVTLDKEDVIRWCSRRLARYKVPRNVVFCGNLPRSTVGKVLRRELREIAMAAIREKQESAK